MDEAILAGALDRARAGDPAAFGELYEAFASKVRGLCRRLLGSPEAAEDATSEVFLRAQRALESYDTARPFPTWLLSIASHHCVDQLRRRRVERRLFDTEGVEERPSGGPSPGPLGACLASEERGRVRRAVEGLPEKYRVPLVLRYYGELSYDEIAASLGLSRNHVATLLFRAKQRLREELEPGPEEAIQ